MLGFRHPAYLRWSWPLWGWAWRRRSHWSCCCWPLGCAPPGHAGSSGLLHIGWSHAARWGCCETAIVRKYFYYARFSHCTRCLMPPAGRVLNCSACHYLDSSPGVGAFLEDSLITLQLLAHVCGSFLLLIFALIVEFDLLMLNNCM